MKKFLLIILYSYSFVINTNAQEFNNPKVDSLFNIGKEFFDKDMYENAIKNFSKAIEIEKDMGILYSFRGRSYVYIDSYDSGIIDIQKAINLNNESLDYLSLGIAYYFKSKKLNYEIDYAKKALSYIKEAIKLNPDHETQPVKNLIKELNSIVNKIEKNTDCFEVKNYVTLDSLKGLYEIYFNCQFQCYIELPKELAWFVVINQNPNSYEAGSSDWFKNSGLVNRWNQQNSNVISREIFLENLGLFINEAKKVGNILILDTQEDNSEDWGLTNSKFKYGIDLNKMNQLKQSSFWKPDESKKYNYLPFRLLDISIIGEKKSNNINLNLSSFVPVKDKIFLIKYDNEEIGYFDFNTELNLDIIEFTLFYQSPEDVIKNSRKNVISLDKTKEMSLIKYEEFLNTLGAYLTYYNLQNYRFIITADDGSRNFTINNNFLFGKSIVGMQELEEIETYYQKELIDIQGWINHPYLR